MRLKTKNVRNQGSNDKKMYFLVQSLSHIPRWVCLVQKTRAKNSHMWTPYRMQKIVFFLQIFLITYLHAHYLQSVNVIVLKFYFASVRRRPGQNRVTWKTSSSGSFIPLQEPIAVLTSYIPHTQMPVWSNTSVVVHVTQPLFRAGHDRGINKQSKPKGLRQY